MRECSMDLKNKNSGMVKLLFEHTDVEVKYFIQITVINRILLLMKCN